MSSISNLSLFINVYQSDTNLPTTHKCHKVLLLSANSNYLHMCNKGKVELQLLLDYSYICNK